MIVTRYNLRYSELTVQQLFSKFWAWYERHYTLNVGISAFLFLLQLVHLSWLSLHVVALRLVEHSFFPTNDVFRFLIIFVDYTETPALLGTSLVYINELRKQFNWKSVRMLFFLNSQWIHLFWITDEFVVSKFIGHEFIALPVWLAWMAIGIDYLELPVIYDTIKLFFISFLRRNAAISSSG